MSHQPVMLNEVLDAFRGMSRPPENFLDGTFGRGGHTKSILETFPQVRVSALDQDAQAVQFAETCFNNEIKSGRLTVRQASFKDFAEIYQNTFFDGILLDLGVSSPQLDEAERGFSFYHDGPLDMRMNQNQELTAADIVNSWSEKELIALFQDLGEVRSPFRIVKAIVTDRKKKRFETTRELAGMIERVGGWRKKGHHPATNYFLALRLKVNEELDTLSEALPEMIRALNNGGRMVVITFHSLEDRIAKNIFKSHLEVGRLVNKKVIVPSRDELKSNPRSRSAKLRAFEKGVGHE